MMAQERGLQLEVARPFGVHLDVLRGEPTLTNGVAITPIARRLALWWPGGAWVYAWPVAIEYPADERIQRTRIIHIRMFSLATFAALGLVAYVVFATRRRVREQRGE